MSNTVEFIGVVLSIIIASIMLNNSIQGRMDDLRGDIDSIRTDMDVFRSEIREDMNIFQSVIRDEMTVIRSDIKELQGRTSSIEGKLELLIDAWDIAQPSPPAIAKQ